MTKQAPVWFALIGGAYEICIACSETLAEIESAQKDVVTATRIVETTREYERGEKVTQYTYTEKVSKLQAEPDAVPNPPEEG